MSLRLRTALIAIFLSAFLLLTLSIVSMFIVRKPNSYISLLESVVKGEKTVEQIKEEYISLVAENPDLVVDKDKVIFPLEVSNGEGAGPLGILLPVSLVLIMVAFFIQYTSSTAQASQLKLIKRRMKEITEGEGALTERVEIIQFDEVGELSDWVNRLMDKLNERNRYERELRLAKEASEASLALAQKIAQLRNWSVDLVKNEWSYSVEMRRLLGISPADHPSPLKVLPDCVHPDDRARVEKMITEARKKRYWSLEFRYIHPDGTERILHQQGETQFDKRDKPLRLFTTVHDLTEHKRAERELLEKENALKAAEEARRLQDEFLSSMSHELRSLLTSVIGFAERIPKKIKQNQLDKASWFAGNISGSASHLPEIINDLLDYTEIEAGKMILNKEEFLFTEVMDQILYHIEYLAKEKGLKVDVSAPGDLPVIVADRTRFTEILLNLISNAIKFTDRGGLVRIKAATNNGEMIFSVEDTLEDAGFQVILAENGERGLEMAREHRPDIIILDRMMPGMSGDEVCKIIKSNDELKKIKIIILSARAFTTDRVVGLNIGADDYLTKPYQPEELVSRANVQYRTKSTEDALQKSKEESESLAHVLCHDLINQLTAIKGFLDLLDADDDQQISEETKEVMDYSQERVKNMVEIIEHVREMRALASVKKKIDISPVSLEAAFFTAQTIFQKKMDDKEIRLNLNLGTELAPIMVLAEPVSLTNTVINNLLSNAIKFSYYGSEINVDVTSEGEFVHLQITDDGIGIPKSLLETVFRPDMPTTRPGTDNEEGTGFGMPLVKKAIDLYGGRINLESRAEEDYQEDHGTTVHIYLKAC